MKRKSPALFLACILTFGLTSCNSIKRALGQKDNDPSPVRSATSYAMTGTWNGNYQTDIAPSTFATMWVEQSATADPHFRGTFNDGVVGGLDGVAVSSFSGTMDGKHFTMHLSAPVTLDPNFCTTHPTESNCLLGTNPTEVTNCPGEFDIEGDYETDVAGNGKSIAFTKINGTNCRGHHTTISGSFL